MLYHYADWGELQETNKEGEYICLFCGLILDSDHPDQFGTLDQYKELTDH